MFLNPQRGCALRISVCTAPSCRPATALIFSSIRAIPPACSFSVITARLPCASTARRFLISKRGLFPGRPEYSLAFSKDADCILVSFRLFRFGERLTPPHELALAVPLAGEFERLGGDRLMRRRDRRSLPEGGAVRHSRKGRARICRAVFSGAFADRARRRGARGAVS